MTQQSQAEEPHDYPNALRQELAIYRPSPALERANGLLGTVPVELRKLGEAIQDDLGLAAETVKLCNSSLFGLPRPVSSLEQAVVATDADIVRTLLLACWLTKLTGSRIPTRENRLFWSHSLLVAQISRRISEWAGLAQPEKTFLAGLLHDVGILPFLTLFSREGAPRQRSILENLGESIESERRRFGTDHCELGGRLSTLLGFPHPLAEVVAKHHQPGIAIFSFPLLPIVGAAEVISQARHLCAKQELAPEALRTLIKDSLGKWLPGFDPSASHHLVEALESDLLASVKRFTPGEGNAWCDSLPSTGAQPEAHQQGNVKSHVT
ncbi:MAG: HDOD domain-containing protein [Acidobacteria bacterium]|nr:HDOD domain-containing protein [Acidobacteriota bacterium]